MEDKPLISRTNFLKATGAVIATHLLAPPNPVYAPTEPQKKDSKAMITAALVTSTLISNPGPSQVSNPEKKQPTPVPSPTSDSQENPKEQVSLRELSSQDLPNVILKENIGSKKRYDAEEEYCTRLTTLDEINKGFWFVTKPELRTRLLDMRWHARLNGELPKLDENKIKWAEENGIHPETLAVCIDTLPKAQEVLKKITQLPEMGKLKTRFNDYGISSLTINPGGMAMLIITETGFQSPALLSDGTQEKLLHGFSNTGEFPAVFQLNTEAKGFENEKNHLATLTQKLSKLTGLKYHTENIQGSARGDVNRNLSGGAIGLQFMPGNALRISELMEQVDEKFNPFDLESSLVGAWIFLALRGYQRGDLDRVRTAIRGWNPDGEQISSIFKSANNYYDLFLSH